MPDFAVCIHETCERRTTCRRWIGQIQFRALRNDYQAMIAGEGDGSECTLYLPEREGEY